MRFLLREVSIGKFTKMSTSPFIFILSFVNFFPWNSPCKTIKMSKIHSHLHNILSFQKFWRIQVEYRIVGFTLYSECPCVCLSVCPCISCKTLDISCMNIGHYIFSISANSIELFWRKSHFCIFQCILMGLFSPTHAFLGGFWQIYLKRSLYIKN